MRKGKMEMMKLYYNQKINNLKPVMCMGVLPACVCTSCFSWLFRGAESAFFFFNNKSADAFIWIRHISNNHSNMACKQSQHCLAPTGFCFCRVSGTSSRHTLDSPVTLTSLRTRKPSGVRCQSRDMRAVHRTSTRITQSRLSVQDRNGGTFLPCNPFLAWTHVRL